jgi:predicted nucleotidyltransferase
MKAINSLLSKAKSDRDVLAVMVFGSYARNEKYRDIDVCLVLKNKPVNGVMSRKRLSYVSESGLDVHVFQQLPLYIRIRVLKEGKILLCKDTGDLYNIALQTAREFAYFKPNHEKYIEAVQHG